MSLFSSLLSMPTDHDAGTLQYTMAMMIGSYAAWLASTVRVEQRGQLLVSQMLQLLMKCKLSSGLPPQEAPVMIVKRLRLICCVLVFLWNVGLHLHELLMFIPGKASKLLLDEVGQQDLFWHSTQGWTGE